MEILSLLLVYTVTVDSYSLYVETKIPQLHGKHNLEKFYNYLKNQISFPEHVRHSPICFNLQDA